MSGRSRAGCRFFCEILEHLLVQHQLGHQELEPLDLDLKLAAAAVGVDPSRIMPLAPTMVGRLSDAELSTNVRDRQRLGQVAVGFPEQSRHFVGAPSLSHEPLLGTVYRGTPISGGPILGEQATQLGIESVLHRAVVQPQAYDLLLEERQRGRSPGGGVGEQARLVSSPIRTDPTSDRSGVEVEELGDLRDGVSLEHPLDGEKTAVLQPHGRALISHGREYKRSSAARTFLF
jgi:hypothetical protein